MINNSFNDLFDYINDNNNQNRLVQKKKNKKLILCLNLLAIALLIGGGYGIKYIYDQKKDVEEAKLRQQELLASQQKKAKEITDNINKQKEEEENKTNVHRDFTKLKEENSDTVAWLYVPDTDIDMPIVKGENNSYYLTHDFDKTSNSMGWAFADYQNTFPDLSTNTIMYGHTYRQTTIFSKLKNVLKDSWLNDENKQKITLDTEKERLIFQVFSVYTIEETNDYLHINFSSKEKYQSYLNKSLKRSIKDFKIKPSTDDKILTLSTCYTDDSQRLVVQAKLIGSY
ncbi:MAG: class B sortase [Bacilli bacterium]